MIIILIDFKSVDALHTEGKDKQEFSFFLFAVTCPPLILEYGEVAYNTSLLNDGLYLTTGYSVDTIASFSCNEFHHRHGSSSVICQSSGSWSGHTPVCNACNKIKLILY